MKTKEIKKLMIDRDLSVQKIADETGFSKGYVSNVINGRYPGIKVRAAIADILEVPAEKLWGGPSRAKRTRAAAASPSCAAG